MRLSFGQELRMVQKQVLAPRMIQSMEILQLPIMALQERIEQEIQENHLTTVAEVTRACNAGAGCRSCWPLIEDILDDYERVNGK